MGSCLCCQQKRSFFGGFNLRRTGAENGKKRRNSMMLSAPGTPVIASTTGRSQITLKPGRSLMDWIRLTSSRSTAPLRRDGIDQSELRQHATVDDCWILLGDKVYDVTEYLSFHPGGIMELMRAAGTDATGLFQVYHSWVNYNTMLKTCLVGTFIGDRSQLDQPKSITAGDEESSNKIENNFEVSGIRTEVNSVGHLQVSCSQWLHLKNENISLEFRDQTLRLLLHFPSGANSTLSWTNIPKTIFNEHFDLSVNNGTISVSGIMNDDSNKAAQLWSSGTYHSNSEVKYRSCEICDMHSLTHDMSSVTLRMPSLCRFMVPIGHHVRLRININGSLVERPYTPVIVSEDGCFISFMIKFYSNGVFTPRIREMKCGDPVEISDPLGCFNAWTDCSENVLMLAAGTGLAPMLRLTSARLRNNKMTTIILFNKKMIDIISDQYFMKCNIPLEHPLLKIIHCLSEPESQWMGEKGLISKTVLSKYIVESDGKTGYQIFICGPDPFIGLATKLLDELRISRKSIYIFQG